MRKSFPYILAACSALALVGCGSDDDENDNNDGDNGGETPVVETPSSIALSFVGRYSTGQFDESAAEIPAYDAASQRVFIVNAEKGMVDVLDLADPANPSLIDTIDGGNVLAGGEVNSVAVHDGVVALAIEADLKTDNGAVAFYNADDLSMISSVGVGAQPDMLTFTPDGAYVLAANEGEPSDDYSVDPEGSIAVINLADMANPVATIADFTAFNGDAATLKANGVRIYGPGASVAQDLEPEYIAVSADSATAWAILQENNAFARIDIASATVEEIVPLGFKDHSVEANNFGSGNGLDTSDEDGEINIANFAGVRGLYLPDAMAAYDVDGMTYLVTANEGDARAWGEDNDAYWAGDASQGFVEEFRVKHLVHSDGFDRRANDDLPPQLRELAAGGLLNPETFAYCGASAGDAGDCRDDEVLGRLNITWTMGYRQNADGTPVMFDAAGSESASGDRLMYDNLYSYGARSFSIWDESGSLIWDSGDAIEQHLASDECMLGSARDIPCKDYFNSAHDEGDSMDSRSDAKGPEPEGVTIGQIGEKTFAFVGLERMGGIMIYDITDPEAPVFMDYFNAREDWATEDAESILDTIGDLGPEGLVFISAEDSPTDEALLVVGNEVSGTTAVYQIDQSFE
ncbi:choice-of-anchor I family protein [Gilvimarinus algae]|uniref:Choice-of-anchor I family protein n=1 Tax=Gilvimarinus algae TaxID=3058037 RepID=A0ABT8TBF5_9GAMM|nr:choice-of-anchor I family protein [Gilvimarinus sp. SDUM040014]MDO3380965.1 choice-of-anchor I family protein [Gilvimarinus sp. SDUM040014]